MSDETAKVLNQRGNVKLHSKFYSTAETLYSEAIELDPSNPKYYSNRCTSRLLQGNYQKALEDANMIIQCDPNWIKGYIQKGSVLLALKRYNDAEQALLNGKDIDPMNETVQQLLQKARTPHFVFSTNDSRAQSGASPLKDFLWGSFQAKLQTFVNIARLIMLIVLFFTSFPIFNFQRSLNWFKIFDFAYLFIVVATIYDNYGPLQFNMRYFNQVMNDLSFLSLLYMYIFTQRSHISIAFVPLVLKEMLGFIPYCYTLLRLVSPSAAQKAYSLFDTNVPRLLHIDNWNTMKYFIVTSRWAHMANLTTTFTSLYQLMMVIPLLFQMRGFQGLLTVFIYIQYLIRVAALQPVFCQTCQMLDYNITSTLARRVPALLRIYSMISGFIKQLYASMTRRP